MSHHRSCAVRVFTHQRAYHAEELVLLVFDKSASLSMLEIKCPTVLDTYISDPHIENVEVAYRYRLHGGHVEVTRHTTGGKRSIATIRDLIFATFEGDGRAYIDDSFCGLGVKWEEDLDGGISDPRRVIERYETLQGPGKSLRQGTGEVVFFLNRAIFLTDAERAAVESREDIIAV